MELQDMFIEADGDIPDFLSFMSMNMKEIDSAAVDRMISCNERITNMAKADEHFTVFLTEHDYFLSVLKSSPHSYFYPHDTFIFGKKKVLERVIDIFSHNNPIYAPLVCLKKYLKDDCGLCFLSRDSLAGNLALRSLLPNYIEVYAAYFFGIVAVPPRLPVHEQPWYIEHFNDVDIPSLFDDRLICFRYSPEHLHSMIDVSQSAVQDMPGTFVLLINPKGVQMEEFNIIESVLKGHGKYKIKLQSQKLIRQSIREHAQSPAYPNLKGLLKYVHGECGLIYVQGGNSVLTFLLQNVVVRALYLPGFVFPRSSLFLTWSKLENEIPIPYKEIGNQTEMPIDSLVVNILRVPNNPGDLLKLHVILNQAHDMLQVESIRLLPLLDRLDPSVNSLGYLFFMEACTSATISKEQASEVVLLTARFINQCNKEQIQMVPEKFIKVCRRFKDHVMQLESPLRGVAPMLTAIRKIQRSIEHLTALHPEYLDLCLLSNSYKAGLSILEEDLFEIDQPEHLLLYCYYGALICIGQKSFGKALDLLHKVLTAPVPDMNAIAVEAYKKYILVSLIHNGQPYIEFANNWSTGKVAVEVVAQKHRERFDNDNNLELVEQAISSICKHRIQRLSQIYMILSLQDLANHVQLTSAREAEMHVLQMIQDGEILGSIDQKDGVVSFFENPELFKTEHICSSMHRIIGLSRKLSTMNDDLSCDPNLFVGVKGESIIFTPEELGPWWIM